MAEYHNHSYVLSFPIERQIAIDAARFGLKCNFMHGLLEFDVTTARSLIRDHKAKTGETLSFTAFLVNCLAQAITAHPMLQCYRNWRNQLIGFEDVDIGILIEQSRGTAPFPHIIRAANQKSLRQIHDELRMIQVDPTKSQQKSGCLMRLGPYFPSFIRSLFYRVMLMNPRWLQQVAGTAVVSAVGMFAEGGGWGIAMTPFHTLAVMVGGIAQKPAVINGEILIRELLCVTISIDHIIVDGAAAARFARSFKQLVESAYGLS